MKISIYKDFLCEYDRLKGLLPNQYFNLINPSTYGKRLNIVCFPSQNVVLSGDAKKALKRANNSFENFLVFGYAFTKEAVELIKQNGGTIMSVSSFDMWTDEGYQKIRILLSKK